ncbi:MAG: amidohydrolase family protein [Myxococcales bacterium]|nr:amidohydrolase family protein [Myxococcales bacterium]
MATSRDTRRPVARSSPRGRRAARRVGLPGNPPDGRIDLASALAAFTIKVAHVNGLRDRTGSLEVGKLADLNVADRNPFEVAPTELSERELEAENRGLPHGLGLHRATEPVSAPLDPLPRPPCPHSRTASSPSADRPRCMRQARDGRERRAWAWRAARGARARASKCGWS